MKITMKDLKRWILAMTPGLSDEKYLKKLYKMKLGKELNLENPQKFTEKLQWLKLHNRKPEYTNMVDKYEVKKYVSDKIGSDHVVPALGIYNSFDEIDFDKLPNQFVLKCTHDSGGFVICRDKSKFNKKKAKRKLSMHQKFNYYRSGREWPYKNVKPRILAEPYIDSLGNPESWEYKLTCFDGKVKNITICGGIAHVEFEKRTNDNYDRDLKHLDWWAYYKNAKVRPEIPAQMDEMIEYAEKLSEGIPQVRVDFYIVDGKVYFGEMTFFTWSGFIEFNPPEQDDIMGEWIKLPEKHFD